MVKSAVLTPQAVLKLVAAFEETESVLDLTIAPLDQLDRLADLLL